MNQEYRNIRDFGAVGDGMTDDTSALEQALSYEGAVFFPAGVYILKKQLRPKTSLCWFGEGNSSIVRFYPADDSRPEIRTLDDGTKLRVYENRMIFMKNGRHLEIRDMKIDANKEAFVSDACHIGASQYDYVSCLEVWGTKRVVLEGAEFTNGLIEGVYIYKTQNVQIKNCKFYENGLWQEDASGLHIDEVSSQDSNVFVSDCEFFRNGFNGLLLNNVHHAVINHIHCHHNGFDGASLWCGASECIFTDVLSHHNRSGMNFRSNFTVRLDNQNGSASSYSENNIVNNLVTFKNDFGILWGCARNLTVYGWYGRDCFTHALYYGSDDGDMTGTILGANLSPSVEEINNEYENKSQLKLTVSEDTADYALWHSMVQEKINAFGE